MKKLLWVSALLLLGQTHSVHAEPEKRQHSDGKTWDANQMIQRWGTNKREQYSFDSSLAAIKNDLKEGNLTSEKLDSLSDWANKLLNGQKVIKKKAEDLLEDLTVTSKSKSDLLNRITLYNERINQLDKVIAQLSKRQDLREEQLLNQIKELQAHEMNRLSQDQLQRQTAELQNLLKALSK